jgi:hypothetical protein
MTSIIKINGFVVEKYCIVKTIDNGRIQTRREKKSIDIL